MEPAIYLLFLYQDLGLGVWVYHLVALGIVPCSGGYCLHLKCYYIAFPFSYTARQGATL